MDRKTFRKAMVAVKLDELAGAWMVRSEVPGYKAALMVRLEQLRQCDVLQARMGGFSTDYRTRVTLYPLFKHTHGR